MYNNNLYKVYRILPGSTIPKAEGNTPNIIEELNNRIAYHETIKLIVFFLLISIAMFLQISPESGSY